MDADFDDDTFGSDLDTESTRARITFHSDYLVGWMELEVREVSYTGETDSYEELSGGEVLRETLATPAKAEGDNGIYIDLRPL
ncbi:hypothetical protein AB0O64_36055 [Streptomyces sp. NPDC088341]|uniref:hypothetical protein n=1 Tax=Streptomyces sp. NPDC088341 TaxID=3154870 RepID=UPI003431BDC1